MEATDRKQIVKRNLVMSILKEKCPNCGDGDVYQKQKSLFKMPVMNAECNKCNYHFDREPGYFLGAMYISYGLAVFQGIITFLLMYAFFPQVSALYIYFTIILVIAAFSLKNYKLSRVIYIHIFPY